MNILRKEKNEKNLILYKKYLHDNNYLHVVKNDVDDSEESSTAIEFDWKKAGKIAAIVCIALILLGSGTAIGYVSNEKIKTKINEQIETVRNEIEVLKGSSGNNNSSENFIYDKESLMGEKGLDGKDGLNGKNGVDGIAGVDGKNGLNGKDGLDGISGKNGINGTNGKNGANGKDGEDGTNGLNGKDGQDGISGLNGKDGQSGIDGNNGIDGINGANGKSTYELAVEAGYAGSETELAGTLSTAESRIVTVEDGITRVDGEINSLNKSLEEVFTSVSKGKAQVASAITDKGVTTKSDATFKVMHDNILTLASQQYNTGYAAGLAAANNASVTYVRHYHAGSSSAYGGCYTIPNYHRHVEGVCYYKCSSHSKDDMIRISSEHYSGKGDLTEYYCKNCGIRINTWSGRESAAAILNGGGGYWSASYIVYRCGKTADSIDSYSPSCGFTDGQILSATIKY